MLWEKFAVAMATMCRVAPDRFASLDGLTKQNGRTIYVSKDESRIRESAEATKPVRIKDSIWFVNAQVSKHDAAILIDTSRNLLGLSASFSEELKQMTIDAKSLPHEYA